MTSDRKKRRAAKRTPEFPALREFFSGYLHQDFRDEYGSAVAAIRKSRQFEESGTLGARSLEQVSSEEIAKAVRELDGGRRVLRIWIK